jgi:tetratricopeptide (TPR) repeat protein
MKLKRQHLVSEGTLSRMVIDANVLWKQREFQKSIEILERASKMDPANARILLDLGNAYGFRYDYAAAERCFDKAARVALRKTEALAAAGERCCHFNQYEMAERFFQRVVEQKDVLPKGFIKLAEIQERLHRLDAAAELVERALHLDANFVPGLLTKASLDRQAGRLEEAEKTLRSFLSKPSPNMRMLSQHEMSEMDTHVRGWYELGGVLDRLKRYDEAMAAYLEAKALLRPNAGRLIAGMQPRYGRINSMKAGLSAEMLQRWIDLGQALQPPRRLALLGGHPRSGTTLLEQVLDSHPDIISAEETTIFRDDACAPFTRKSLQDIYQLPVMEATSVDALRESRRRYFESTERFLGQPVGNRLLLDKNPSLMHLIPDLIRVFPEIKFLVALRDPRDVCWSCFIQPFRPVGEITCAYLDLETTVEEYAVMMDLWRTIAPLMKNPFLEVRYEDMVNDLESVARRTLDFLGAPWDARVLGFDEHARKKVVLSPTFADVVKPVYKGAVGRWRNYQKYFEPHLAKLEPFVKAFGYE